MATSVTITRDQAAVKTEAVGVKVKILTVNRRSMTLAMFRQLPEEGIIDAETGEFRGIPWGRVNYHPECRNKKHHVHVVWESEGMLKHACEYDSPPVHRLYGTLQKWLEAAVLAGVFREGWSEADVKKIIAPIKNGLFHDYKVGLPEDFYAYRDAEEEASKRGVSLRDYVDELRKRSEARIDAMAWPGATGAEILEKHVEPLAGKVREFEAKWEAQYKALEQLDQLFIAV